jgi:hypothetical protein
MELSVVDVICMIWQAGEIDIKDTFSNARK